MEKGRRIKDAREFQTIMQRKRYFNSKAFTVYISEKKEAQPRYGLAVSKKLGNAVFRNKTKRQIRMMLQSIDDSTLEYDCIVLVRRYYLNSSFADNQKDLEKLLKTVKM